MSFETATDTSLTSPSMVEAKLDQEVDLRIQTEFSNQTFQQQQEEQEAVPPVEDCCGVTLTVGGFSSDVESET